MRSLRLYFESASKMQESVDVGRVTSPALEMEYAMPLQSIEAAPEMARSMVVADWIVIAAFTLTPRTEVLPE